MRFRKLGLDNWEIESGPYTFMVSRGRVIGMKDESQPGLAFRSQDRGGKDVKAYTRHLRNWIAGRRPVDVPQRWIDQVFDGQHHLRELLVTTPADAVAPEAVEAPRSGQERRRTGRSGGHDRRVGGFRARLGQRRAG